MRLLRKFAVLIVAFTLFGEAVADNDEDDEAKPWKELAVQLPAAPASATLQQFYVSAASENQFFVDLATLSVGADGVVRYVLVVLTPAGGRNVTYEGMRCETREFRGYASGRRDGTWSKSRNNEWSRIREAYANRHHAALFSEYFCPGGVIARNAAEAIDALRHGVHRDNRSW